MSVELFNPAGVVLEGQHLIEASAGTGKTHNITFLVVRLVIEKSLTVDRILVVTFTEAATEELKGKIRARLTACLRALQGSDPHDDMLVNYVSTVANRPAAEKQISAAIRDFDQAAIYTIHGFCNRLLKLHAFETGTSFDAVLSTDDSEFIAELGADFWAKISYQADPDWVRILQMMKYSPERFAELAHSFSRRSDIALLYEKNSNGLQRIKDARTVALAILTERAAEIGKLFETDPGVNRRSYNKRFLPNWLGATEEYLRDPLMLIPAGFDVSKPWIEQKHPIFRFTGSVLSAKAPTGKPAPEHEFFQACDALLLAAEDVIYDAAGISAEYRSWLQKVVPERKRKMGVLFFDDLISQLDLAISDSVSGPLLQRAVKNTYGAALIDEFQDTDTAQFNIFSKLFGKTSNPFFMIGDPKQSIYGFRGGDVFAYLKAVRTADHRHSLGTNWRSDPGLIRAVNALFARIPDPFLHSDIGFHPVASRPGSCDTFAVPGRQVSPLEFLFVETESDSEEETRIDADALDFHTRVASDVASLLQSGAVIGNPPRAIRPSDIAILVFTHRQGKALSDALRECGVASVNTAQASVYQSEAAVDFYRVLLAVASPLRAGTVRAALGTWIFGLTAEEIVRVSSDDELWNAEVLYFEKLRALWLDSGFMRMTQELLQRRKNLFSDVLRFIGGERFLTDLVHLIELLRVVSFRERCGVLTLIRHLEAAMLDQVAGAQDTTIRLETEADTVQLVTIHKSKGLQYPVVYLPFLWKSRRGPTAEPGLVFHDPADHFSVKMDLGSRRSPEALQAAQREDLQEQMRLLYVALTRAQYHCRVVWGAMKGAQESSLGRLLHRHSATTDGGDVVEWTNQLALSDLGAFAEESSGAAGVSMLTSERVLYTASLERDQANLACAVFSGRMVPPEVMTSFSRLAARGRGDVSGQDEHHGSTVEIETRERTGTPSVFGGFPRGITAGTCLHKVFEVIDFEPEASATLSRQIDRILGEYGFAAEDYRTTVIAGVQRVLSSRLKTDDPKFRLESVRRADRLNELEFLIPITHENTFRSTALAKAMAVGGDSDFAQYAMSLSHLRFFDLSGFLQGFIDMVFVFDGKWYIVDYKSNDLGPVTECYLRESMWASMTAHHYILQYHLYAVALDRLLRARLPGYVYDNDFGGVYYLYLRGMGDSDGRGVFFDRPPEARIGALSALFNSQVAEKEEEGSL